MSQLAVPAQNSYESNLRSCFALKMTLTEPTGLVAKDQQFKERYRECLHHPRH